MGDPDEGQHEQEQRPLARDVLKASGSPDDGEEGDGSKEVEMTERDMDSEWKATEDENGEEYWYDEVSGRTTWSDKSESGQQAEGEPSAKRSGSVFKASNPLALFGKKGKKGEKGKKEGSEGGKNVKKRTKSRKERNSLFKLFNVFSTVNPTALSPKTTKDKTSGTSSNYCYANSASSSFPLYPPPHPPPSET